jgi:hypothetical protein
MYRGEEPSDEVPVPGIPADPGAWILQRLELEPVRRQANLSAVPQEPLPIRRYQVGHWRSLPRMPMQPETAIHGVDHSVAT